MEGFFCDDMRIPEYLIGRTTHGLLEKLRSDRHESDVFSFFFFFRACEGMKLFRPSEWEC